MWTCAVGLCRRMGARCPRRDALTAETLHPVGAGAVAGAGDAAAPVQVPPWTNWSPQDLVRLAPSPSAPDHLERDVRAGSECGGRRRRGAGASEVARCAPTDTPAMFVACPPSQSMAGGPVAPEPSQNLENRVSVQCQVRLSRTCYPEPLNAP